MTGANRVVTKPAVADELYDTLARYGDLLAAQTAALEAGSIITATRHAKTAEGVLAEAGRLRRRLVALQTQGQIEPDDTRQIESRLRAITCHAMEQMNRLGALLAQERGRMLEEIAGPAATADWSRPALVNIQT